MDAMNNRTGINAVIVVLGTEPSYHNIKEWCMGSLVRFSGWCFQTEVDICINAHQRYLLKTESNAIRVTRRF